MSGQRPKREMPSDQRELAEEISARLQRLTDMAHHAPISLDPTSRAVRIWADKIADEMRLLHNLVVEVIDLDGELVIQVALGVPQRTQG